MRRPLRCPSRPSCAQSRAATQRRGRDRARPRGRALLGEQARGPLAEQAQHLRRRSGAVGEERRRLAEGTAVLGVAQLDEDTVALLDRARGGPDRSAQRKAEGPPAHSHERGPAGRPRRRGAAAFGSHEGDR